MRATAFGGQAVSLLAACLAIARPGELRAQARVDPALLQPPAVTVPAVDIEPDIDARLDEDVWTEGASVQLAWEWFPGDNTPPPVETTCRLLAGRRALHIGCDAIDADPSAIRGHFTERDGAEGEDHIAVLLDPAGTNRRGYRFEVTALGVQADALYSEDTGTDATWDATWSSAGRITADGYVVELTIPYRALRRPGTGDEREGSAAARGPAWRLVIERSWPRGTAVRIGSVPLDRDDSCLLCQAQPLIGLSAAPAGHGARLQPTLTATHSRAEVESDDGTSTRRDIEADVSAGLSGRWSPSPATRVALTLNPDFSQVEADAAEFEVNRRFALSFAEKRPFFLDDADFFNVAEDLLFTRSVVDPLVGAKLTWQRNRHAAGAFITLDRVNSRILPGNQSSERISTDNDVVGLVGRYRLDLPNSSSIGVLGTARFMEGYHNAVAAVDGTVRLGRSHRLQLLLAGSHADDEPEVEALTGRSGGFTGGRWNARYDFDTRNWEIEAGFRGFTSGFRSDAGLLQRVDLLGPEFQVTRLIRPGEATWYDLMAVDLEAQRLTDFAGNVVDEKVELGAGWAGPLQTVIEASHAWRREALGSDLFALQVTEIEAEMRPSGLLSLEADLAFGDEIDADNVRLGRGLQVGAGLQLLLGRSLRISLNRRLTRLRIPAGEVFRAWLSEGRFEYHFGLHLHLRTILQYRQVRRDPALWVEPVEAENNRMFAQVLLSYELTPQTVAYAGYSGTAFDFEGLDLVPQQRSLFVKLGYGWQF